MGLRDLGYRPYEGERLPAANNTKVMLRYGLRRAWASWLVKLSVLLGWVPCLLFVAYLVFIFYVAQETGRPLDFEAGKFMRTFLVWQLWSFVAMIGLGAGAPAIAEDLGFKAFQFYFAKPVTPPQYLLGRTVAVGFWCLMLTLPPALLVLAGVLATSGMDLMGERVMLLFPTLIFSLVISSVTAVTSVAVSAISKSRALTMSSWMLIFFVPAILAKIVDLIAEWPWLRLASLPSLMELVGDALFQLPPETDLRWFHGTPILVIVAGGCAYYALARLRAAEVI